MSTQTIQAVIDNLQLTLTEYIEATYHIADLGLVRQRQNLLAQIGNIAQQPYLESTPRYTPGPRYEFMPEVPSAAREAFQRLSDKSLGAPVVFNPPYKHQADAIRGCLTDGKNLMVMTGTGSGKTESFLLPILGKLAIEAKDRPKAFRDHSAIRAIVLYPMNALVNDQLGRLRLMFGNQRTIKMFEDWAGRPARFARYTSRTPYAGVRSSKKDPDRLGSIGDFFVEIEKAARDADPATPQSEASRAKALFDELFSRGKWPAKESVADWFGEPGEHWRDKNGYKRAILRAHDAELMTRHEVQENPPDLLITNYSMLEYMMLRPIERPIFDKTRAWLKECPDEKLLIVMDEAHLYRGAQGAEVGLLLRRLRERLGAGPERLQIICATASFNDTEHAGEFGAQLTGVDAKDFVPVTGELNLRQPASVGSASDIEALCHIDLPRFYNPDPNEQFEAVRSFLEYRGVSDKGSVEPALFKALESFAPFNLLVNETMKTAMPLKDLGSVIFANTQQAGDHAVTALLAIGSRARLQADQPGLLPCRIHTFFRGLPGLWVCMDPQCSALEPQERGGPTGKMYAQPRTRCDCNACVLEYYTCRHCGTSYGRAYTDDVAFPSRTWSLPGQPVEGVAGSLAALDLLLEEPSSHDGGRLATFDLMTGQIDPETPSSRTRHVYLPNGADTLNSEDDETIPASPGLFMPCGCCGQTLPINRSSVQDHQTKGDQPFQALIATQLRIQPPGPQAATEFAPLRGRKVLIFSDSRQMAARLAPHLQTYSLWDTLRALIPAGFAMLNEPGMLGEKATLDHLFVAVLTAANKFRVRVRPELNSGESMPDLSDCEGGKPIPIDIVQGLLTEVCPENLLSAIIKTLRDRHLGLEPLAVASVREASKFTSKITALPAIPGLADSDGEKLEIARAWFRCWTHRRGAGGLWLSTMPAAWWNTTVKGHTTGKFKAMNRVLPDSAARKTFEKNWLPTLLQTFTQVVEGSYRLLGKNLTLQLGGEWRRCKQCTSVHRPISKLKHCIDCNSPDVELFDPNSDAVFEARKGFYRAPVIAAMTNDEPTLISLIAAEHTAQLNTAQSDEAFSTAEDHELRFQDIDMAWRLGTPHEPAIDVLSSTTTMEVGIDIGALSGVALRNMPPGRSNYQQRSGRAGRRGNAFATVIAFGRADSHDDNYFVRPDEMIRGPVTDPRLTLENADIARRHVRAYLLQRYSEDRLPQGNPEANANLFSVLGTVDDFRGEGVLNRNDLALWLDAKKSSLIEALNRWLPSELSKSDRQNLIDTMKDDVLAHIDNAISFVGTDEADDAGSHPDSTEAEDEDDSEFEVPTEPENADDDASTRGTDKFLDRLLYCGVLPRYAFPTDVASFYVFDATQSSKFRAKMKFAPSQGLNVALSQYAPNKQIWINNKQYTSKTIYSPYKDDLSSAWQKRRLYFECSRCGHATTEEFLKEHRGEVRTCEACGTPDTFGPGRVWLRPPGFAHPVDLAATSQPDEQGEIAYATRAKLVMSTPAPADGWTALNDRIRAYPTRTHLLVSNTGPGSDGYVYCVACGRIEAQKDQHMNLTQPHAAPYPDADEPCPGTYATRHLVLGTDFIADICLFSIRVDEPFVLRPATDATAAALRTVCEALAKAAAQMLEIESGEIVAEFRPAQTSEGASGHEAEIFLYDTLAGGAGFSPQMASRSGELFARALEILRDCPEQCDCSCYRCLRSFKNKFDHYLLDRQLGEQLLEHALSGHIPDYSAVRASSSIDLLCEDLNRQFSAEYTFQRNVPRNAAGSVVEVPIVATRSASSSETWIALASPIAPDVPTDGALRNLSAADPGRLICVDDLLIRRNLAAAVRSVIDRLL